MNQIAASVGPVIGRIFFVIEDSDPSIVRDMMRDVVVPDPMGQIRFFESVSDVYSAVTTNANDVIVLNGQTSYTLTTGLAHTKNRVHWIGMDGGDRLVQQGTKIQVTGAVDTAYVVKDTGVRNSFINIKFIQSSTHANALTVFQGGGEGTLFKNCSFVFGTVDNLDQTTAHEFVAGTDSATFINCMFGADTLLTSAARSVFHVDQVNGFEFKSNILENCTFLISSSSSTATFVRLDAVGDILFTNIFRRCTFVASVDSAGGAAIAEAVQTGTSTVKGCIALDQCAFFNCTDVSTATGGRNTNVQILAATSTAGTAGVGVTPTA